MSNIGPKIVCFDTSKVPVREGDLVKVVARRSIRGLPHGAVMRAYGKSTLTSKNGKTHKFPFLQIVSDHKPSPTWVWSYVGSSGLESVYQFQQGEQIPGIVRLEDREEKVTKPCYYCGDVRRDKFYTMLVNGEWGYACQDGEACDLDDPAYSEEQAKKRAQRISKEKKKKVNAEELRKEHEENQKIIDQLLKENQDILDENSYYDEHRDKWLKHKSIEDNAKAAKGYTVCGRTAFCTRENGHPDRCFHVNALGEKSYL